MIPGTNGAAIPNNSHNFIASRTLCSAESSIDGFFVALKLCHVQSVAFYQTFLAKAAMQQNARLNLGQPAKKEKSSIYFIFLPWPNTSLLMSLRIRRLTFLIHLFGDFRAVKLGNVPSGCTYADVLRRMFSRASLSFFLSFSPATVHIVTNYGKKRRSWSCMYKKRLRLPYWRQPDLTFHSFRASKSVYFRYRAPYNVSISEF